MRPFLSFGISACLSVMGLCTTASAQELEPNNTCATAQEAGAAVPSTSVSGSLDAESAIFATDIDFFRFSGEPGQSLRLVPSISRSLTFFAVLDDDCRALPPNDRDFGPAFEVPASGHFKVAVGGDGLFSGQGSENSGPYTIGFTEGPTFVGSISGRAIDAESGASIPADFARSATVQLDACFEGSCLQFVAFVNGGPDGRFRIERSSLFGTRIAPGQYRATVVADGYQPASWTFTAAANEDVDLGDVAVLRSELTIEEIRDCQFISPSGGTCRYSAQIRNNRRNEISGTAFSTVYAQVGFQPETRFEANAAGANAPRMPLRIPALGTQQVSFEFEVPASLGEGAFICMQIFAGTNPFPVFNVTSASPELCLVKRGEAGLRAMNAEDRAELDSLRRRPPLQNGAK